MIPDQTAEPVITVSRDDVLVILHLRPHTAREYGDAYNRLDAACEPPAERNVMTTFVPFIDITAQYASQAPFVKGGIRAYYATGTPPIEETAAQIAAARAAGMGIVLIDQTPGLHLFAAGLADVADVENYAGTPASAAAAVAARQANHWQSTLYVSYNSLPALKQAIANPAGVLFGVADYSWSQAQSEQLLDQHADWAYCQYGDPASNPSTLVPGTSVTLRDANADINIAKASWAGEFLPPPSDPPVPHPAVVAYAAGGLTVHQRPATSTDGGKTWVTSIGGGTPSTPHPGVAVYVAIEPLIVHSRNVVSTDGGHSWVTV